MSTSPRYSLRLQGKERNASPQPGTTSTQRKKRLSSQGPTGNLSPSKRRKTSNETVSRPDGRVKGRRGHLQLMTEMPMDVFFEILDSLEPVDLLHLSWASKTLRSIIMGQSARYLWDDAFETLYASPHPPPPCPPDLNLAQYTKLLFDKRCMECNSPHGSHVVWPHRLRVCGNCLEGSKFTVLSSPHRFWMVMSMMRTFVHGRYQIFVLTSEYNDIKSRLDAMGSEGDEFRELTRERTEWVTARRQDEWKFVQWQREQKRDRKNELEEIRLKRRSVIVDKLTELGWGDELELLNSHQLWTFPGMRVAKPLTDKAWETLCPELIDHLEAVKALRLEREKQDRINRRCDSLAQRITSWNRQQTQLDALPKVLDFALSEPFKSFILSESHDEPTFIIDESELQDALNSFLHQWNESRNQFLTSLIPGAAQGSKQNVKGKGKADSNLGTLGLATTLFQCPGCDEPVSYPRILAHECLRSFCTLSNKRDTDPEHLTVLSAGGSYRRPWLCEAEDLAYHQEASDIAKTIVQECGANVNEATAEDMDSLDCRLECVRCTEPKKGRLVMKWRMAILHDLEKHSTNANKASSPSTRRGKKKVSQAMDEPKWRVITDPYDLSLIRTKESNLVLGRRTLICRHCGNGSAVFSDQSSMQGHWDLYHSRPELTMEMSKSVFESSLAQPQLEPLPVPDEAELAATYEQRLDHSIKSTHSTFKIPIRKKVNEDVEMA